MPSTQTRKKLKKFQFIQGTPAVDSLKAREAEKENVVEVPKSTPKVDRVLKDENQLENPKLNPPSTPATRLPLAELVGNVDDSSRHPVRAAVSPEEQLCWRGSQPILTPLSRKKRARSSSPAGPSQEDPKGSMRRNAHTPQMDPATELWEIYRNDKGTTGGKAVAFAHLISESSPRSSATAGSVGGLRRWASCGVEFPTSARKRRKTTGVFDSITEPVEDVFHQPSSEGGPGRSPEKSDMAVLLQKMRAAIPKPQIPSSSSPLPEPDRQAPNAMESPLRRHDREDSDQTVDTSKTIEEEKDFVDDADFAVEDKEYADDDDLVAEERRSSGSSDEFGDADFDDDMVDILETSTLPSKPPEKHVSTFTEPANPASNTIPSLQAPAHSVNDADSDDEFGLDEDIFAADLEQVASLYDTREDESPREQLHVEELVDDRISSTHTVPAAPPVIVVDDDDDDDFGDDIDADEFAAAEFAATQAPTVRRPQTM
jgi:DNA replication ATP-dependent helicase Dna2